MYLLDHGAALGERFSDYRARWFDSDYNGWRYEPRPNASKQIARRLRDNVVVMRNRDYPDMPEIVEQSIDPPLPANLRNMYDRLEAEMVLQLQRDDVVAANAAVLLGKLLQLSNGAMYINEGTDWEHIHDHKLDMLEELVEEANGEPVLVAYSYRHDIPRIKKRFGKQVHELDKKGRNLDDWNAGRIPILLGHPASMGHGLNMQHGGRILAWFGLPWSYQLYEQTNARLYRQGQDKPVFIYHLMFRDAVETRIREALMTKRRVQDVLMESLKTKPENLSAVG
jgi:SNF2 family DNA or RNA helicase